MARVRIGFCFRLLQEDVSNGLTFLSMLTPKAIEAAVSHASKVEYQSVADVDRELAKLGVRSLRDIFEVDFVGTPVPDEAVGASEPEILPLERGPTK
jgi:hypothetical protein